MTRTELLGKQMALLLFETEETAFRLDGQVGEDHGRLCLIDEETGNIHLRDEWLEKIKPVNGVARFMFKGIDFVLSLTVGPIPIDVDPKDYIRTEFQLPKR